MTEPQAIRRERALLDDLRRFAADRVAAEQAAQARYIEQRDRIERQTQADQQRLVVEIQSQRRAAESEYAQLRTRLERDYQSQSAELHAEYDKVRRAAEAKFKTQEQAAQQAHANDRWEATSAYDARKNAPVELFHRRQQQLATRVGEVQQLQVQAAAVLQQCGLAAEFVGDGEPQPLADPLSRLAECIQQAQENLVHLQELKLPRLLRGPWLLVVFALAFGLSAGPAGLALSFQGWHWLAAAGGGMVVLGGAIAFWLTSRLKSQVARYYEPLATALVDAVRSVEQGHAFIKKECERQLAELRDQHRQELANLGRQFQDRVSAAAAEREDVLHAADQKYPARLAEVTDARDRGLAEANRKYPALLSELSARMQRESNALADRRVRELAANEAQLQADWQALVAAWQDGLLHVRSEVSELNEDCRRLFPSWRSADWEHWQPPVQLPPVLRFGEFEVRMRDIPGGVPEDPRVPRAAADAFTLPALLPFPGRSSLLFRGHEGGRSQAVQAVQAVMLRLLVSLPAGKVRFTIIDPVGLGENFAGFMHLADSDEALVTNRIWTEPEHIEHRLADLTEIMENVIQKYLRNEFPTIEAYNEHAGEVAEPFRFLVVANFPANFTDAAARRLVSIASSGARCGVQTLITVDTRAKLPQGFALADLEKHAAVLEFDGQRFRWANDPLGEFKLQLDAPPPAEQFTSLVRLAGEEARKAGRVEVPFEHIVPPEEAYWTGDSRRGVDTPLGRAGATKLQHLRLGSGTSQHVLVAGKTGSGKSTLWHVMITNLALIYRPDEVEFYLIDFKKGVEFKTYAACRLPHARVVAIESEREFGLSVLQRLDAELKVRGDEFRDLGVQDIAGYRDATGQRLPRILLIVDEFQEIFVEDDRIAQEAALLLDRLVRQGRAFGIHVLLGSQTLGGAYTLARSTIGQMAVRIALQCSEADAHLILSDDNTAARLLSRPGEAIYNDANGLLEGNKPFQIVWLDDEDRDLYLGRVAALAAREGYRPPRPQIVFEGNVLADLSGNHLLQPLLESPPWADPPRVLTAWLGDAVAIKDPTAAVLRAQSGSNLMIVGQQPAAALGTLAAVILSVAAQYPPAEPGGSRGVRFLVLDGSPADAPHTDFLPRLADALPHPLQLGRGRDTPRLVQAAAQEVARRTAAGDGCEAAPLLLVIHDLGRLRDLRRDEGDFGFSGFGGEDKPPSPARQFADILRDGPPVNVHVVLTCDGVNNLMRTFDRPLLREFELRVLFQMSPTDSSNLIDSPLASRLGQNRALFYSEELGTSEKFRPYELPSQPWLDEIRQQFAARLPALRS